MDKEVLIRLAEDFGLPCIEREDTITIMGEKQLLIFNKLNFVNMFTNLEEQKCQLKEIY